MTARSLIAARFELGEVAGRGGMGVVHKAVDMLTGKPAAVKLLLADVPDLARFEREAELLSTIEHPGIVRYLAHGDTGDGRRYLAMEWLDGEDLSARLARGPLGIADTLALGVAAASALAAVHAKGVVHRDVKPQNLFLPGKDVRSPRLLDFGIARTPRSHQPLTRTGVLLGTPTYMPPEQVRGLKQLDARADVYALGCVLWECLTGEPAFVGEHVMAVLARVLLEDCPSLRTRLPDVPDALEQLVANMTSRDVERRPRAEDVATQLSSLAVDAPLRELPRRRMTGQEQRLVCIVAGGPAHASGTESTLPPSARSDALTPLQGVAARFGAQLEPVPGGSFFVSFIGASAATDQVADAARCALALRAWVPGHGLVVTTGRALVEGASVPLGEVVDRAATLLLTAPAGAVTLDPLSTALLDGRFLVQGHTLTGERAAGEAEEVRALLGLPTPFVGRERELSALDALIDECFADPGARVALVTAPAGFGKTRLRTELVRRRAGVELWLGRGDPQRKDSGNGLLRSALGRAFSLDDGMSNEQRARHVAARVGLVIADAEHAERTAAFLSELMGSPLPETERPWLAAARRDPRLMADQVQRSFEDWCLAEAKKQPVMLVLEDLHWGDASTVRLVDAALRHAKDEPFFVLALARPEVLERFPRLWAERGLQHVSLGELRPRAAEQLVRKVLGERATDALVRQLVERAAGNAFYLEELIRQVAETGHADALPDSVVAMAQLRLEGLTAPLRALLRAGAVFGEVFWLGAVTALSPSPEAEAGLRALVEQEVLVERPRSRFPTEREFAFRHALLRDAAYAMMTGADRVAGHRAAGAWLSGVGERDFGALARHFKLGDDGATAARWFASAAEQALNADDLPAARQWVAEGEACGARGEVLERLLAVDVQVTRWLARDFDGGRVFELLELATPGSARWCRALGDASLLTPENLGLTAGALRKRYLASTPAAGAEADFAIAGARMTGHLSIVRRGDEARTVLEHAERFVGTLRDSDPALDATIEEARAFLAAHERHYDVSTAGFDRAMQAFERAGDVRNQCVQMVNLCFSARATGVGAEFTKRLEAVLALGNSRGLTRVRLPSLVLLAELAWERGEESKVAELLPADTFPTLDEIAGAQAMYVVLMTARLFGSVGQLDEVRRLLGTGDSAARVLVAKHTSLSRHLAWTLLELGDHAGALRVLEGGEGFTTTVFDDLRNACERPWLRARALRGLDRVDEARAETQLGLRALEQGRDACPPSAREKFVALRPNRELVALADTLR